MAAKKPVRPRAKSSKSPEKSLTKRKSVRPKKVGLIEQLFAEVEADEKARVAVLSLWSDSGDLVIAAMPREPAVSWNGSYKKPASYDSAEYAAPYDARVAACVDSRTHAGHVQLVFDLRWRAGSGVAAVAKVNDETVVVSDPDPNAMDRFNSGELTAGLANARPHNASIVGSVRLPEGFLALLPLSRHGHDLAGVKTETHQLARESYGGAGVLVQVRPGTYELRIEPRGDVERRAWFVRVGD